VTISGFASRQDAGRQLARRLKAMAIEDPVILALPRGGVPVAAEVARELNAPLDLVLVRKIGAPGQPELAAAAIVDGAAPVLVENEEVMRMLGLTSREIGELARPALAEIDRRRLRYLGGRKPMDIAGKTAVVVDDGIATGTTARAALKALRGRGPKSLILAVPVASPGALASLRNAADRTVALLEPGDFYAIGPYYAEFHQLTDDEVMSALSAASPASPD
jgi:putative phosphoribosyl transferase